ncbi:uncharacterized protein TNCT_532051 [Trichonephila clavata]|uniref:Uncharacterized protein n=2 Tax=Trichonephila TaxID=2585208 RepID=A0A8X6IE32_TRICU|nr:uncharacterized protein TNCT_532051 [Trichonephila clavata]
MRRLKSTYTLLSGESSPSRQEAAAASTYSSGSRPFQQFSWPQILSAETLPISSDVPDVSYFSSSTSHDEISHLQNVQNVMEHQHNLLKYDLWNNHEDIRSAEPTSLDISSADSESCFGTTGQFDDVTNPEPLQPYPMVTTYGSVTIMLRHLVRVDVSPEGAVYVQNFSGQSVAVISGNGEKSCIIHSNSRVFQDGQEVHVMTYQNRIAKIGQRGVVFSSSSRSLAYLVDESGTKSTADRFLDLRGDYSLDVFYDQQEQFDYSLEKCYEMASKSFQKSCQNGDDIWIIGGTQIKQDRYGNIEVSQDYRRRLITVLPTIGEVSVHTPYVSVTVGCYSKRYLTVQMDNRRITSGFCGLTVQNGSQKAGLDRNGKVVIF